MFAAKRLLTPVLRAGVGIRKQPLMPQPLLQRHYSKFISDIDDDYEIWPKVVPNLIVNVCPQGEFMVVERLGVMQPVIKGGWFVALPFIDNIRYCIDMRERAMSIRPQSAITKDNVHVQVSGNLYCQFIDAEKAAYGSKNPIYAVKQHAQSAMRAAIGELELDQILHARAQLNTMIRTAVQEAAVAWGLEIKRYEITEISPDKYITEAMDKQAAAERERRKKVLEAEGDKRSAELESEGQKIRLQNESEGALIKVQNEALARKRQLILEAEGEAEAVALRTKAQADAVALLANTLHGKDGRDLATTLEAAKILVAREYIAMYSDIGSKSNTMIFADRPADINALFAQASTVISGAAKMGLTPAACPPVSDAGDAGINSDGSDSK